jgi:hypothetical protein
MRDYGWRGGCATGGVTDAGVGSGEKSALVMKHRNDAPIDVVSGNLLGLSDGCN